MEWDILLALLLETYTSMLVLWSSWLHLFSCQLHRFGEKVWFRWCNILPRIEFHKSWQMQCCKVPWLCIHLAASQAPGSIWCCSVVDCQTRSCSRDSVGPQSQRNGTHSRKRKSNFGQSLDHQDKRLFHFGERSRPGRKVELSKIQSNNITTNFRHYYTTSENWVDSIYIYCVIDSTTIGSV